MADRRRIDELARADTRFGVIGHPHAHVKVLADLVLLGPYACNSDRVARSLADMMRSSAVRSWKTQADSTPIPLPYRPDS